MGDKKARHLAALLFVLLACLPGPVALAQTPPPVGASASSTYAGTSPANAFDGNASTSWQGGYDTSGPFSEYRLIWGFSGPQTVTALGVTYYGGTFPNPDASEFDCSTDGSTWIKLADITSGASSGSWSGTATCTWVSVHMSRTTNAYSVAVRETTFTASPATTATPTPTATPGPSVTYAALGDSITHGTALSPQWSWTNDMTEWTTPGPWTNGAPPVGFANFAVDGTTSSAALSSQLPLALASGATTIFVMTGSNDPVYGVSTSTTASNLASIISGITAASKTPVIVDVLPRAPVGLATMRSYSRTIQDAAATAGVRLIDPWPAFDDGAGNCRSDLCVDGTHPSWRGTRLLAGVIASGMGWSYAGQ